MANLHPMYDLRRARGRGGAVDRSSIADAERVLQRLLPDAQALAAAERILAHSVRKAHALHPGSWTFTLFPAGLRLSVGRTLIVEVLPNFVDLISLRPLAEALAPFQVDDDPLTSLQQEHATIAVPARVLAEREADCKSALDNVLPLVATQGSPYRMGWSEGIHGLLARATGELPLPNWHGEPVRRVPRPDASPATDDELLASEVEALRGAVADIDDEPIVRRMRRAFFERFSPDRLRNLEGRALLHTMHRRDHDAMGYWLEFKNDEVFEARRFGSIAGGSAFKFGLFQRAEGGEWVTGGPRTPEVVDEVTAIRIATKQRDELLAAYEAIRALPNDPDEPAWGDLPATMADAAPTVGHLGFVHKTLALWCPDRLDDYHSVAYQAHVMACLGVPLPGDSLYEAPRWFLRLQEALGDEGDLPDLNAVTRACNGRYGAPVGHWRVGTGDPDDDQWPAMRDGGFVAIGWDELGDLSDLIDGLGAHEARATLKTRHAMVWPSANPIVGGKAASQLRRFHSNMQPGDVVYAARGLEILGVGEVIGDYRYAPEGRYRHRRAVRWLTTESLRSPSPKGLRTTVKALSSAYDIQAAARRQIARHPHQVDVPTQPTSTSASGPPRQVHPIEAQLDRKGQVLLFGPPGTGKTYWAHRVARDLTAYDVHGKPFAMLTPEQRAALEHGEGTRRIWVCTFHPAYGYEDFVEGLRPRLVDGQLSFEPTPGLFRIVCDAARAHPTQRFVLLVDEFNRGDAPRIFGELLTLLELDKRDEVEVVLPVSGDRFTVPKNVRLIATMNTADKSIAHLDAALRRRFGFLEYLPDPSVLGNVVVEGIPLGHLLTLLNQRLVQTLGSYARNLQVGHSYLMNIQRPQRLQEAFRYDVLPLLQEYCGDDPDQLHALLDGQLYDRERQRIRAATFAPGAVDRFLDALRAWDPDGMNVDPVQEDEDDDGEVEADEDAPELVDG